MTTIVESPQLAIGVTLAFNSIGWDSQNILFNLADAILGTEHRHREPGRDDRVGRRTRRSRPRGAVSVTATSVASIVAHVETRRDVDRAVHDRRRAGHGDRRRRRDEPAVDEGAGLDRGRAERHRRERAASRSPRRTARRSSRTSSRRRSRSASASTAARRSPSASRSRATSSTTTSTAFIDTVPVVTATDGSVDVSVERVVRRSRRPRRAMAITVALSASKSALAFSRRRRDRGQPDHRQGERLGRPAAR